MSLPNPAPARRAVITGASSGIGAALAWEFARRGYDLAVVARRRDRLESLADELTATFAIETDILPCDLEIPSERAALIDHLGRQDIAALVNNAGFGTAGPLIEADSTRETREVTLNVVALHELTLALLPAMVARGEGAILMTGSCAGNQPLPLQATYAATKAFVNSFAESLHFELAGTGVSCTLLAPGPVRTEFADVAEFGDLDEHLPGWAWVSAEHAAREAIEGLIAGRRRVVPGAFAQLQNTAGRLTPIGLSGRLIHRTFARLTS